MYDGERVDDDESSCFSENEEYVDDVQAQMYNKLIKCDQENDRISGQNQIKEINAN